MHLYLSWSSVSFLTLRLGIIYTIHTIHGSFWKPRVEEKRPSICLFLWLQIWFTTTKTCLWWTGISSSGLHASFMSLGLHMTKNSHADKNFHPFSQEGQLPHKSVCGCEACFNFLCEISVERQRLRTCWPICHWELFVRKNNPRGLGSGAWDMWRCVFLQLLALNTQASRTFSQSG